MPKGFYNGRNWTDEDVEVLVEMLQRGSTDAAIGRRLGRTGMAVNLKRKRLRLACRTRLVLSSREVARRMGIPCSKVVTAWITKGYLRGHQGSRRGPNRQWVVTVEDLYDFVADSRYRHLWDPAAIADPELRLHARESHSPETFLTTGQVAERFFTSSSAVWMWIQRGQLHAIRHQNWMIPESALEGFVMPSLRPRVGVVVCRYSPEEDARMQSMRSAGASYSAIGRTLGRTASSVSARLERLRRRLLESTEVAA